MEGLQPSEQKPGVLASVQGGFLAQHQEQRERAGGCGIGAETPADVS